MDSSGNDGNFITDNAVTLNNANTENCVDESLENTWFNNNVEALRRTCVTRGRRPPGPAPLLLAVTFRPAGRRNVVHPKKPRWHLHALFRSRASARSGSSS